MLLGLPAAHTTCAILCAAPAYASGSPEAHCGGAMRTHDGVQLSAVEPHACDGSHLAVVLAVRAGPPARVMPDGGIWSVVGNAALAGLELRSTLPSPTRPPRTAPPPLVQLTRVVLRV